MAKRKTYSDKFRAECVAMLTALGYPNKDGVIGEVARKMQVTERSLRTWYKRQYDPPTEDVFRQEKKDLATLFEDLAHKAVGVATKKIETASATSATTVAAISIDKMRLLRGLPTEIIEYAPRLEKLFRLMAQHNHNPDIVLGRLIERYEGVNNDADVVH